MIWKTITVCEDCYRKRRHHDQQLVGAPIKLAVVEDRCHDCGAASATIPIRAQV